MIPSLSETLSKSSNSNVFTSQRLFKTIRFSCDINAHHPEGIATSVPIYYSSGSRRKAFWVSFFSGVTEPLGAIIGYLLLRPFFNDTIFGVLFGAIAGIMMFISLEELLPMAREYEKSKITIISVVIGMAIIALSLLLFL